jgi:putative transposase
VIGRNKDWQRDSKMSKKVNQTFTQIPYEKLIKQLKYKSEEMRIKVIILEEQYTSKSSFIDNDPIPTRFGEYEFSGKRIKRGLYISKYGISSWELDALEPRILAKIVSDKIISLRDEKLYNAELEKQDIWRSELRTMARQYSDDE